MFLDACLRRHDDQQILHYINLMKKYFTYVVFLFIVLFSANTLVNADEPANNNSDQKISEKDVERFSNALRVIKNYYVEKTADDKLFENAIRGMLGQLDPHSDFLNADDLRDLKDMTTGSFSGLGIEITTEEGVLKVVSPLDGSPAQKAGIKPGDLIVLIDNVPVKSMTMRDAVKKMRGAKGTTVTLTVVRKTENKPLKIKLVRDDIKVPSVKGRLLEGDYAYVRIASFQTGTAKLFEQTLTDLKQQAHGNLKGLILDLRNNPGGLLDAATDVSDTLLDIPADKSGSGNNLIVYTKGRIPGSELKINTSAGDIMNDAPIVVLINEGSASGSEIVAGALQDHKRALIVGTNSFGKGSVQTVIPLDSDSAVKLTTALYYTPSGRSIQAEGIKPDVTVKELKIAAPNDKDDALVIVKEADLAGHLHNASEATATAATEKNDKDLPKTAVANDDYQLYEALNILKALVITRQQNKN
jgi:carboxyl-terminal processing protease